MYKLNLFDKLNKSLKYCFNKQLKNTMTEHKVCKN